MNKRQKLPRALGAIRADLEDDTATEYDIVEDAQAQAEGGKCLIRLWQQVSADGVIDARERFAFNRELAAHVRGDIAHVSGDLLSLNNNRVMNSKFCALYAASDPAAVAEPLAVLPSYSSLDLGEVVA